MNEPVSASLGATLTPKQEAALAFTFENDPDEWLVLLAGFMDSHGAESEALKAGLLEGSAEWKARVAAAKTERLPALNAQVVERLSAWQVWIQQLLTDPGQVTFLRIYLNTLIMLKAAKVKDFGPRGEIRKKINQATAHMANEAYSNLEQYLRAVELLNKSASGKGRPLPPESLTFYTNRRKETARHVGLRLGAIILLREAGSPEAGVRLRTFVREQMIAPLELHARAAPAAEQKVVREHIASYNALLQAVDVAR